MKKQINNFNEINEYGLSSAIRRIFARLLDMIFVCCISVGIFIGSTLWIVLNHENDYNHNLFCGMFLLAIISSFIIFFLYFICLPYCWKGYTLFKKCLKLKTYDFKNKKHLFIRLIKKEVMIWMLIYLILFIFSMVLFGQTNPLLTLQNLILFQFSAVNNSDIISPIFEFLFVLSVMPLMIITIHMIVKSRKKALHDFFSDTCVIYLVPIVKKEEDKTQQNKINLDLPGIINEDILKEIIDE